MFNELPIDCEKLNGKPMKTTSQLVLVAAIAAIIGLVCWGVAKSIEYQDKHYAELVHPAATFEELKAREAKALEAHEAMEGERLEARKAAARDARLYKIFKSIDAESTPDTPAQSAPTNGEVRRVNSGVTEIVMLATSEMTAKELTKLIVAKEKEGILELANTGDVIAVDQNTRVRVIDLGVFRSEVRILEGRHKGQRAIAPTAYLKQ